MGAYWQRLREDLKVHKCKNIILFNSSVDEAWEFLYECANDAALTTLPSKSLLNDNIKHPHAKNGSPKQPAVWNQPLCAGASSINFDSCNTLRWTKQTFSKAKKAATIVSTQKNGNSQHPSDCSLKSLLSAASKLVVTHLCELIHPAHRCTVRFSGKHDQLLRCSHSACWWVQRHQHVQLKEGCKDNAYLFRFKHGFSQLPSRLSASQLHHSKNHWNCSFPW